MNGSKSLILMLYTATLVVVLKAWYGQASNTGMPTPSVIAVPTYAYAILLISSDVVEGLPTVFALGAFFAFWNQANSAKPDAGTKPATKKASTIPPKKG